MTQMTDIPEYGQFIKQHAPPQKDEIPADIVEDAVKILALQFRAEAQSLAPEPDADRAAQIECVEEDLRRAQAEFADPRGHAVRRLELCELLRLPRVCALARCRKSAGCRGGGRCLHQVKVPRAGVRWRLRADARGAAAVDHERARERARRVRGVGRRDGGGIAVPRRLGTPALVAERRRRAARVVPVGRVGVLRLRGFTGFTVCAFWARCLCGLPVSCAAAPPASSSAQAVAHSSVGISSGASFFLAHDLVRPAYARRSIHPRERTLPRLRAGGNRFTLFGIMRGNLATR